MYINDEPNFDFLVMYIIFFVYISFQSYEWGLVVHNFWDLQYSTVAVFFMYIYTLIKIIFLYKTVFEAICYAFTEHSCWRALL